MSTSLVVGVDPHRMSFSACALDERGGAVAEEHFANTSEGYANVVAWARQLGEVTVWGVESASGLGRPLAVHLVDLNFDVRDVPPHRTAEKGRGRHEGKSDRLDAYRIAREAQVNARLAAPFKHSRPAEPDPIREQMALWHNARRSLTRVRVQLLGEIDAMIQDLPEHLRTATSSTKTVRAKVAVLQDLDHKVGGDPVVQLRTALLRHRISMLEDAIQQDRAAATELKGLVAATGSSLCDLVGISTRAAAEILVEVGDIRRFTEGGFARYTGTAPIPASSGEGAGAPTRHRLSRGGNRRLNAAIHRMAVTQLRFEPRARALVENARSHGHTRREAMRVLKRHLAAVIFRTMVRDARRTLGLT